MKFDYKKGFILSAVLIIIAILIGIIFRHDIAFVFAGIGTIILGITILACINKGNGK